LGECCSNITGPDIFVKVLSSGLNDYNYDITVVTNINNLPYIQNIEGIKIQKSDSYQFSNKYINNIYKILYLWKTLLKVNCNIYISYPGLGAGIFCKLFNKKFICHIASDAIVDKNLITREIKDFSKQNFNPSRIFNNLDIILADVIVVQNQFQKNILIKNFSKKEIVVISNPIKIIDVHEQLSSDPAIILWVGSIHDVKQPCLFLRIAKRIQNAKFIMIAGHSGDDQLYKKIELGSKKLRNFEFIGLVPHEKILWFYQKAAILVNTSVFEGFPNAFLEAWMCKVPVVSLNTDPDEIICMKKMGFHSRSFETLISDIFILLNNKNLRKEFGENGRKYVKDNHDITIFFKKYIEMIDTYIL